MYVNYLKFMKVIVFGTRAGNKIDEDLNFDLQYFVILF